ncbi:MAG: bifunctional phosphoglucose/phosphomannose isomerase [Patescibacteria group bacterium]
MEETILNLPEQFSFEPQIINQSNKSFNKYVVCGMGGSHLAGDLLRRIDQSLDIRIHKDYGLPKQIGALTDSLIIVSSYSGNTEEALDSLKEALARKLTVMVISSGGQLLTEAKAANLPYIELPKGFEPRAAIGCSLRAIMQVIGRDDLLRATKQLAETLKPADWRVAGDTLAQTLKGYIPIIYASNSNYSLAYNWKIRFNETAKIPAFYNLLPELNHNELAGFAKSEVTANLNAPFYVLFLADPNDDQRIIKRLEATIKLYTEQGLKTERIDLPASDAIYATFANLILADWTALALAKIYNHEPDRVPLIEEFKKGLS